MSLYSLHNNNNRITNQQNQIDALIRFGYALVIVTFMLMIWASLAGARDLESTKYPPCLFSPLCTCSKASPNDLGILQCKNVPYPAIPRTVNNSKVIFEINRNCNRRSDGFQFQKVFCVGE